MLLVRKNLTSRLSPLCSAFTSSVHRLLSTPASPETPSLSPTPSSDFAVQYLIASCSLSSDRAIKVSRYLPHLKSPEKPDAVLQFLRQAGVTEPNIRAAASRNPRFLSYSVENCLKPRFAELQEIGFSPDQFSLLFSICPNAFSYVKLAQKVRFWLSIFGSVEELLHASKRDPFLLSVNLENSVIPNISFLEEQCQLSLPQIIRLTTAAPRVIRYRPEALKVVAKRAEELGVSSSSRMFVYALIVVASLNQCTIDSKLNNLRNLGFSQVEVTAIVTRLPCVLLRSEQVMGPKIMFLLNEADCDKVCIVTNPVLFTLSLEKRLKPRNLVRKLLDLKGLPLANKKFTSYAIPTDKQFLNKFVIPCEHAIPGLHQAYMDACASNTAGIEWFKSILGSN